MSEHRRNIAKMFHNKVEVCVPGYGNYLTEASDLCEESIFVRTGHHRLPPLKAEISIRIMSEGEDLPAYIPVQVIRHQAQGMDLKFLSHE